MWLHQDVMPRTGFTLWAMFNMIYLCSPVHGAAISVAGLVPGPVVSSATAVTREPPVPTSIASTVRPSSTGSTSRSRGTKPNNSPRPTGRPTDIQPTGEPTGTFRQVSTTDAAALERWNWYREKTAKLFDRSQYDNETITYTFNGTRVGVEERIGKDAVQSVAKRDFGDFAADGYCSSTWGAYLNYHYEPCRDEPGWNYEYGHVMRAVVKEYTSGNSEYRYWYNATLQWWDTENEETWCERYYPYFNQCQDEVYNPNTDEWEDLDETNDGYGWITNHPDYYGHTVRTIWDCHLNREVIQYDTVVSAFGAKPIQYVNDGMKYYRFYDANNFAWFAACPSTWPGAWKEKRQNIRGRNSNPVWGFWGYWQDDWQDDKTPFPEEQIPDYDPGTTYTAMYWPLEDDQLLVVDGHTCQIMAVSRPGLRHATAKMVDIPAFGYPSILDERYFPTYWDGYDTVAWSWYDAAFWWYP
ncbi:hypothetical protein ABW19_dt0210462 [Dactylella cylindrospora]|nr:hypothetical protein ABW19_dt0210462 [Dactylella cylindrospora]